LPLIFADRSRSKAELAANQRENASQEGELEQGNHQKRSTFLPRWPTIETKTKRQFVLIREIRG
jgi:hypothetical protein